MDNSGYVILYRERLAPNFKTDCWRLMSTEIYKNPDMAVEACRNISHADKQVIVRVIHDLPRDRVDCMDNGE